MYHQHDGLLWPSNAAPYVDYAIQHSPRSAVEALELHVNMVDEWSTREHFFAHFMQSWLDGNKNARPLGALSDKAVHDCYVELMSGLVNSQVYWVAPDIHDITVSAGTGLVGERLRTDDPPAESGSLFLPLDLGYWQKVHAIKDGKVVSEDIPVSVIHWRLTPRGILVYPFSFIDPRMVKTQYRYPRLMLADLWAWDFDRPWAKCDDDDHRGVDEHGVVQCTPWMSSIRCYLLALWRFMAQEIYETDSTGAPRALARRASRRIANPTVRTVRLRRVHHSASTGGSREWSCQWAVRGHWRTLRRGTDRERKVWVSPYTKGPEDRPFRATTKIVSIER